MGSAPTLSPIVSVQRPLVVSPLKSDSEPRVGANVPATSVAPLWARPALSKVKSINSWLVPPLYVPVLMSSTVVPAADDSVSDNSLKKELPPVESTEPSRLIELLEADKLAEIDTSTICSPAGMKNPGVTEFVELSTMRTPEAVEVRS